MVERDTSGAFDSPASYSVVTVYVLSLTIGGQDGVTVAFMLTALVLVETTYTRVSAFKAMGAGPGMNATPPFVHTTYQLPTVPREVLSALMM